LKRFIFNRDGRISGDAVRKPDRRALHVGKADGIDGQELAQARQRRATRRQEV
jgi:hypothetical protein